MWCVIISVIKNESRKQAKNKTEQVLSEDGVEFLGFVNMYTKADAARTIQAFHIVAMALFQFDSGSTDIGHLLVAREMRDSSIKERLMQLVQLLQLQQHSQSVFYIEITKSRDKEQTV